MAKEVPRRLGWPNSLAVDAALLRARTALAGVGSFESAKVIRSQREGRNPWTPSSELRRIVREAPADPDLLADLADVRGAELGD